MKTRRTVSALTFLTALVLAALVAAPAVSQNLISNPDFDANDNDWFHDTSAGQSWSGADADACAGSGSLTASSVETVPGYQYFKTRPTDCVAVTPGETLHVSLDYWSTSQMVRLYLTYCTDLGCRSCGTFGPFIAVGATSPGWSELSGSTTIPASGVAAVFLDVDASLPSASGFSIGIDRVYLGLGDRIAADGFEAGSTCRWSSSSGLLGP